MNTLDAGPVLLTCGDHHGSRALAGLPTVVLPSCPGRAELDRALDNRERLFLAIDVPAPLTPILEPAELGLGGLDRLLLLPLSQSHRRQRQRLNQTPQEIVLTKS